MASGGGGGGGWGWGSHRFANQLLFRKEQRPDSRERRKSSLGVTREDLVALEKKYGHDLTAANLGHKHPLWANFKVTNTFKGTKASFSISLLTFYFSPTWYEVVRVNPTRTSDPSWSGPTLYLPHCNQDFSILIIKAIFNWVSSWIQKQSNLFNLSNQNRQKQHNGPIRAQSKYM